MINKKRLYQKKYLTFQFYYTYDKDKKEQNHQSYGKWISNNYTTANQNFLILMTMIFILFVFVIIVNSGHYPPIIVIITYLKSDMSSLTHQEICLYQPTSRSNNIFKIFQIIFDFILKLGPTYSFIVQQDGQFLESCISLLKCETKCILKKI